MKGNRVSRFGVVVRILLAFGVLALAQPGHASREVPLNLQAAIFKKVFSMNPGLSGNPGVAVVHGGGDDAEMAEAVKELTGAGLLATAVPLAGAEGKLGDYKVVYLCKGSGSLAPACASAGKLTICGDTDLVRGGNATVGIGLSAGKPKILLKKSRVKAEGQEFNSSLLNLAEIID
jgi:hypothetical protein